MKDNVDRHATFGGKRGPRRGWAGLIKTQWAAAAMVNTAMFLRLHPALLHLAAKCHLHAAMLHRNTRMRNDTRRYRTEHRIKGSRIAEVEAEAAFSCVWDRPHADGNPYCCCKGGETKRYGSVKPLSGSESHCVTSDVVSL